MMAEYYGTKRIFARPMNRQAYNDYRGWTLPADEDGSDPGYLVEYCNESRPNHPDHDGYISWSPDDIFEESYEPTYALSFSHALMAMKEGKKVARTGWNRSGMWIAIARFHLLAFSLHGHDEVSPTIFMNTNTSHGHLSAWTPTHTDMMAEDWHVLPSF